MSRKICVKEKRQWLEMYEDGKTESQIARELGHDLRTVVKGIQEASRDRNLARAEMEMLRTALLKHQGHLTGVLEDISDMLVVPEPNLKLREENGLLTPTPLPGALLEQSPTGEIALKIHGEEKLEWSLLEEHLKGDKIWTSVRRWRELLVTHVRARWQFRQLIRSMLEKKAGFKFKSEKEKGHEYLQTAVIDLLYEVTTNRILGVRDETDVENRVTAGDDGYVRFGNTELAKCRDTQSCRKKIISVFTSLPKTDQAAKMKETFDDLTMVTRSTKRIVDELLLLGMITGKCRVCAKLAK